MASLSYAATPGKLLVIVDRVDPTWPTSTRAAAYMLQEGQLPGWTRQLLNGWGVSHKTISGAAVNTEVARTGLMVWGAGTPHAYTEQFDAVAIVNFRGRHQGGSYPSFRPESLTITASGLPTVPVLMIASHITALRGIAHNGLIDTLTDSTGCGDFNQTLSGSGHVFGAQSVPKHFQRGFPEVYQAGCYTTGWITNDTLPPAGGLRPLICEVADGALEVAAGKSSNSSSFVACGWCDSINYAKNTNFGEVVQVWERSMSHVTGAKPIVFVWPFGYQQCQYDSVKVSTENYTACEFDPWSVVMGIARLDSLTGGKLIQRPISAAPLIEGIAARSGFHNPGGIAPDDTLGLYSTIDSLRLNPQTAKIRWTLAGNPDSTSLYANEIAHWKLLPMVRWTPLQMRGIDTTAAGAGAYGSDTFGRYRFRAAVGDGSGVGADTSITSLLKRNRWALAASVGGMASGLCVAPFDDWSPKNATSLWQNCPGRDSVLYAIQRAGFSCLLVNSQRTDNATAGIGYSVPGQATVGCGSPAYRLNLLAHSGYAINGSALQWDMRSYGDSVPTLGSGSDKNYHFGACPCPPQYGQYALPNLIAYECQRFTASMFFTRYRDWDFMPRTWVDPYDDVNTPLADMIFDLQHGSIFRMSAQDFGSGYHTPATRPGYWRIKSMANAFAVANRIAGREVLRWSWPEDITP